LGSHRLTIRLTTGLQTGAIALAMLLPAMVSAADPAAGPAIPTALDTGSIAGPALRMVLSLGAVLALVAGLAWLAQRLRAGGHLKSGLIEVVSGVSLGTREKVVLLRVGHEQVLVGVSAAGMRTLHVIRNADEPRPFATLMENKP
jgi:flagellar protein FliO/FliZ